MNIINNFTLDNLITFKRPFITVSAVISMVTSSKICENNPKPREPHDYFEPHSKSAFKIAFSHLLTVFIELPIKIINSCY